MDTITNTSTTQIPTDKVEDLRDHIAQTIEQLTPEQITAIAKDMGLRTVDDF